MSLTSQLFTTTPDDGLRIVRTEFPHKRLSTPREAINPKSGSDCSDHSGDGNNPQSELPSDWTFDLAPAGSDGGPLLDRLAGAFEHAERRGLRLFALRVRVEVMDDPDGVPVEAKVRHLLKDLIRKCHLRASWPERSHDVRVCHSPTCRSVGVVSPAGAPVPKAGASVLSEGEVR